MKCQHSILRGVNAQEIANRFRRNISTKVDSLGVSSLPEVPACLEGWSDTDDKHWHFYTEDGGADPPEITNGKVTTASRTGWGVVVWRPDHIQEFFGPVVTSVRTPGFLGAQRATNNTGELSAIIRALQFSLYHRHQVTHMYIHYDSEYAAQVTQGHWKVHKNIDLARRAQKLWACACHFFHVEFVWVKGHQGHLGNEKAYACATRGKQQQVQDMPLAIQLLSSANLQPSEDPPRRRFGKTSPMTFDPTSKAPPPEISWTQLADILVSSVTEVSEGLDTKRRGAPLTPQDKNPFGTTGWSSCGCLVCGSNAARSSG